MTRGAFITLEGGEGAGKSTQLRALAPVLTRMGYDVLTTREPGGSPAAEALRELLLFGGVAFSLRAEIMAHFAARCDHVDNVIRPAIEAGRIVLCDRFFDSTMAYQGYGQGRADPDVLALIARLSREVGLVPDITILFEVAPAIGRRRIEARAAAVTGGVATLDRYEQADPSFHLRVAEGFAAVASSEPGRFLRVSSDADSPETITAAVASRIESFLKAR
ncbi:thymidylate kinase [Acetobacter nitrogenifigens DSM 23921 = NBRC 105050]|uniref:Thymidylate kinase n=1 Tax=Acetobacter nitrogenifigens DSM 23921 = NBRC 105050 TaxID=1120919 RepID=A0A511XD90_9PROT|nr:dTMP kinase [Acetobacter nitrogenifigens]GBQ90040.1 thymidylate kinase [Acetobacter nitrogenifigens DSM 23921 = NBRC 105050]GEN60920.1 thymidylate kinase [Acetobacter nitrogenifigens DSM 23921 = NBRC 105050]